MFNFLQSPLPIMLGILIFSALSWPRIRSKLWARLGRVVAVLLAIASVTSLIYWAHQKAMDGLDRRQSIEKPDASEQ